MKKIAIQVPCEELSKAVQRYLFDKGYKWCGDKNAEVRVMEEKILYIEGTTIWCGVFAADTYTPLTVDEFFEREAVYPRKMTLSDTSNTGRNIYIVAHQDDISIQQGSEIVLITWEEYDKIGKLRPKEANNG